MILVTGATGSNGNKAAEVTSSVRDATSQNPRSFDFARDYATMRSLNAVGVKTLKLQCVKWGAPSKVKPSRAK